MKGLRKISVGLVMSTEKMENDRIAKMLYAGKFAGSSSMGQPRKEGGVGIDIVKDCLKKK